MESIASIAAMTRLCNTSENQGVEAMGMEGFKGSNVDRTQFYCSNTFPMTPSCQSNDSRYKERTPIVHRDV
jgi:hypothetical protein